jgi:hypothetical protein
MKENHQEKAPQTWCRLATLAHSPADGNAVLCEVMLHDIHHMFMPGGQ